MKIRYVLFFVFFPYYLKAQDSLSLLLSTLGNQGIAITYVCLSCLNPFGAAPLSIIPDAANAYSTSLCFAPQIAIGYAF
jgi:hypothetical protein